MSRYSGNAELCPHGCGLTYGRLRTGMRYQDVYAELMDYSDDPAEWKYKRRGSVLGRWFEIKQRFWDEHCNEGACELDPRNIASVTCNMTNSETSKRG